MTYPLLRPALRKQRDARRGDRARRDIALGDIAAHAFEQMPVGPVFDAFGDDFHAQAAAEVDTGLENRAHVGIAGGAVHEGAVDLELGERQTLETLQARMAGAVVVDRKLEVAQAKA
jgi:hypothetical protein